MEQKVIVEYNVTISYLDDGVHFPKTYYSDSFIADDGLRDSEIKDLVDDHVEKRLEMKHHRTLSDMMEDPSFISIQVGGISVKRQLSQTSYKIYGPAKDYADKHFETIEEVHKFYSEIAEKLKNK